MIKTLVINQIVSLYRVLKLRIMATMESKTPTEAKNGTAFDFTSGASIFIDGLNVNPKNKAKRNPIRLNVAKRLKPVSIIAGLICSLIVTRE